MCECRVKWCTQNFGNYSEIVLIYDNYILNQWDENDPEKFNRFWDWFNEVEGADLEAETLTNAIEASYNNSFKVKNEDYSLKSQRLTH